MSEDTVIYRLREDEKPTSDARGNTARMDASPLEQRDAALKACSGQTIRIVVHADAPEIREEPRAT